MRHVRKKISEWQRFLLSVMTGFFCPMIGRADDLQAAAQHVKDLTSALMVVVPAAATLTLVVVGVLYIKSMISRETLVNWIVGSLIAGSASAITGYFFT